MKTRQLSITLLVLTIALFSCQHTPVRTPAQSQTPVPEWSKNTVIYEVNIRQYTPEGTFAAFSEHLPRLQEMGVDLLWLMPIHPVGEKNRKGPLGSYYSVQNYKTVNPEFGTMDDFKMLVDQAHELGMRVIIDWVANHTSWDNQWTIDNPDFYAKDSAQNMFGPFDWTDVAQLDYTNTGLRRAMTDALIFWVREADIDGYRCDVAGMVPVDFWEEARHEIEKIKPVFMLAEDEDKTDLLNSAFNANYGWSFHHLMNKVAQGTEKASAIATWFAKADSTYPTGTYAMQFTSNHDENSWNGTEYERMGEAVKTFAVLSFTAPGIPLIYSGQEAGFNKRLRFFEKDTIEWDNMDMAAFYKKLTVLKKANPALANGSWGGKTTPVITDKPAKIVAFARESGNNKVIALLNLSADTVTFQTKKQMDGEFTDYFAGTTQSISSRKLTMLPWEYKVYIRK